MQGVKQNEDVGCITDNGNLPLQVASISVDGGRAQIREEHHGRGVHNPSWIETKVACFQILESTECRNDPRPQLPKIFSDKDAVKHIVEAAKIHTKNETLCWAKYIEFVVYIWQGKTITVIRRLDKWIA